MKRIVCLGFSCLAFALCAATVPVSIDGVHQRWPWETKIDVDFTVTCPAGETADVSFVFTNGESVLSFPAAAVFGSQERLTTGSHRITLDPLVAGYTNRFWSSFGVTVSSARETPLYLIVDLTKAKGEAGQITYLSASDIKSGAYGSYVENPVSGVQSLVWTGVNADVYKTTKYAMRRVPAGTFMMGVETKYNQGYITPTNRVTLTSDFYIGVFETTQKQWELVMGSNPSYFTKNGDMRPVEGIKYSQVRGATADVNWPADGYGQAANGTFLQKMCEKTGLVFDLPTYAQWQYASAYTVTGYWFNNKTRPADSAHWQTSPQADAVARYTHTAGEAIPGKDITKADHAAYDTDQGTAIVGSYAPSVLGLYDMHANVWEFLLDWAGGGYAAESTDPTGPTSGSSRMWCGGSFRFNAHYMKLGFTGGYTAGVDFKDSQFVYLRESGFRAIVMPK